MSSFIQRQNIFVKLILYLLALFIIGSCVVIILGVMFTETDEEIPNWIIIISFIGSTILSLALFVGSEHNGLQKLRTRTRAIADDELSIRQHMDNLLFQLDLLLDKHMQHEKEIYLHSGQEVQREHLKKVGTKRTLEEVKSNMRSYPSLASDNEVMRLFSETVKCNDQLLRCRLDHNALAAEFNARISSFPSKFFKGMWKFEEILYFNVHDEKS